MVLMFQSILPCFKVTPYGPSPNNNVYAPLTTLSIVHLLSAAETKQSHIKFKKVRNTYRLPFVIYADF